MLTDLLQRLAPATRRVAHALHRHLQATTRPPLAPLVAGALADLPRTKPELLLENALLRQQVTILRRGVRRPRCTLADRALLVLLASRLRTGRQALFIVQPDTHLRWHRQLFRRTRACSNGSRPRPCKRYPAKGRCAPSRCWAACTTVMNE